MMIALWTRLVWITHVEIPVTKSISLVVSMQSAKPVCTEQCAGAPLAGLEALMSDAFNVRELPLRWNSTEGVFFR